MEREEWLEGVELDPGFAERDRRRKAYYAASTTTDASTTCCSLP